MQSIWQALSKNHFSNSEAKLKSHYDICIVGAGLYDLYCAVILAKQGYEVFILEASEQIGQGASAFSTGKLTIQHGTTLQKLTAEIRAPYVTANERAISNSQQSCYHKWAGYFFQAASADDTLSRPCTNRLTTFKTIQ